MRIWRLQVTDPWEGTCLSWHPSRHAAEQELVSLRRAAKNRQDDDSDIADYLGSLDPTIDAVDVPTAKTALVAWLNANLNRDNG